MYIKKKPNSYVRERDTEENHRWNNDAYCNIDNRRYTNIYRKKKDMKLFFIMLYTKEKNSNNKPNKQTNNGSVDCEAMKRNNEMN